MALPDHLSQTLPLFPMVVKALASSSLPTKKLVYIYLTTHAEHEPDLALLSINTIQKSLSHASPQIRALALTTMSSIRVPVISQIVCLAIKKGAGDMSPIVRKAAALAVGKCYRLDPSTKSVLEECIVLLMSDRNAVVVGAAIRAWGEVCCERWDLWHGVYRSVVRKIMDMDEWSQVETLGWLNIYARRCFPRRTKKVARQQNGTASNEFNDEHTRDAAMAVEGDQAVILDSDLDLLLRCIRPLLQSRTSAVVIAVARCYITLGTEEHISACTGPMIALLRGSQEVQQVALYNIVYVCLSRPHLFISYATHFLVRATDPPQIWSLKLEMLTLIFPHADLYLKSLILHEIEHFSHSTDRDLVRESVRAIGRCAQSDNRTSAKCLKLLLNHVASLDSNLVAESLTVVRHLIQQDPQAHRTTVVRLAKNLDTMSNPHARATIIWLVGEFSGFDDENNIASDVLRILAKGFAEEAEPAKFQIVLLAAKVYLHHLNSQNNAVESSQEGLETTNTSPDEGEGFARTNTSSPEPKHPVVQLWQNIILLARYDTSYGLRDRTRLFRAVLSTPSSTQLATLVMLAPKPVPHTPSPSESHADYALGSASLIIGDTGGIHGLPGYENLPDWVQDGKEPDASLRDTDESVNVKGEYKTKVMTAGERLEGLANGHGAIPSQVEGLGILPRITSGQGKKTLDDWLAEEAHAKAPLQALDSGEGSDEEEDEDEDEDEDEETRSEEATDDEDEDEDVPSGDAQAQVP